MLPLCRSGSDGALFDGTGLDQTRRNLDGKSLVSTALAGQVVGLKQEGILRWRAHFFDVDLGTIEIAPLANMLTPEDVSSVTPVNAPDSEAVNASVTQDALLNARAVNA